MTRATLFSFLMPQAHQSDFGAKMCLLAAMRIQHSAAFTMSRTEIQGSISFRLAHVHKWLIHATRVSSSPK